MHLHSTKEWIFLATNRVVLVQSPKSKGKKVSGNYIASIVFFLPRGFFIVPGGLARDTYNASSHALSNNEY